MSSSVRPHRWQPTRLPRPWDSPGKNTAVGCLFLLQCMKVKSESEVAQSSPTLRPMDCSLPGSSVHGFSRQEYWNGVTMPSPVRVRAAPKTTIKLSLFETTYGRPFWDSQSLGRLIRSPGSLRRKKGSRALEEIEVWNSQGGGKDKHLFFSTFLSHIKLFFL